eukprot:scaffold48005_cov31-Tisochrysis_lutea.AAC.6
MPRSGINKRRWNRQLRAKGFTRSGPPPSNALFVVESALEMAHIMKRYADSALHQKSIVKLIVLVASSRRRTTRSRSIPSDGEPLLAYADAHAAAAPIGR